MSIVDRFRAGASPPSAPIDMAAWRAAVKALPIEARCELAPLFAPSALTAARHNECRTALIAMAIGRTGSARARAKEIAQELSRYAASAWRFDAERAAPHDSRNAAAHKVLRANGGEIPSDRTIRRLFVGGPE